jgi:hypothetical protein
MQPRPEIRPLDSAGNVPPLRKQTGTVGGLQLNQDLTILDVSQGVVG